ncbi:MAG: NAD(P)/FAD-dependent oxidoreductase [Labilithrix sp.]|nr:NAD(P)/FAD-dependent oxidoreductase [Labilithrix sp.]
MAESYDAIVVGSGPNGLAAAIEIARAGRSVLVLEAEDTIGGGARTAELNLPGFHHDICSAIHPLGVLSPFLRTVPLEKHGVTWIEPPIAVAHPLDDGTAATLQRGLEASALGLGEDAQAWRDVYAPFDRDPDALFGELLKPVRIPRHPFKMARFGLGALQSATRFAESSFRGVHARAMFASCAAHSIMPLESEGSASFGLVLAASAHAVGWPFPKGGSQTISDALVRELRAHGGDVRTGERVTSLRSLPRAKAVLLDVMPRSLVQIAGDALPASYGDQLRRYRHGPGVFKMDFALRGPVPWTAAECHRTATVHVGGTLEELAGSERAPHEGRVSERPFVLVAQQSLFDDTRAPPGQHTLWAYCHVPNGSKVDMSTIIEDQIERFAPGFRDLVLARSTMNAADVERHNANYVGGDIGGGLNDLPQTLARPVARWNPYTTPNPSLFLCSSATPPGGGVHGMCGYWAARAALRGVLA